MRGAEKVGAPGTIWPGYADATMVNHWWVQKRGSKNPKSQGNPSAQLFIAKEAYFCPTA